MIDFTVIEPVRQHFGDSPAGADPDSMEGEEPLGDDEPNAPFFGKEYGYFFDCPDVDSAQWAVLTFNAFGVTVRDNIIRINSVDLPGGLYQTPVDAELLKTAALWHTQTLLVPQGVLRDQANTLYVQSTPVRPASDDPDLDDFILDNLVIWFKVRSPKSPAPVGPRTSPKGVF